MSTASLAIVNLARSAPPVTISASSPFDMRGMWIWTSARSIDWCSAISCSTSSATPTSTTVARGSASESVLIVSANSNRSSAEPSRSNSSRKTATRRSPASDWSPRLTSCGVASAASSEAALTRTSRAYP